MHSDVRHRVLWLVLLVGFAAAGMTWRLYVLQVARGEALRAQAGRQHQQRIQVLGRRGSIVDRKGRELAVSLETWSLFAHPARVGDKAKAARLLAPVLDLPAERILSKLTSGEPFVWLKRRLDPAVADAVRRLDLPVGKAQAFDFKLEGKRFYPRGPLGVHVIGFADIDQKGIEGIESALDERLQCSRATYLATLDAKGGMVLQRVGPPERLPEDVVLTLDLVLQHVVERELDRAMQETGAKAASAVLIDPRNGQVLALANRPTVDLNAYGSAALGARKNRAITDLYEPGSTFKIVPAAAALDQGKVSPGQLFDCQNGVITIAGHTIRDHDARGILTLRGVLEHSSNVGMIKVARTLPKDVLHDYVRRFGFGRKTGIELPGETAGLLTPPARWSALTQPSMAMGYEIGVSALQMAGAAAAVANGGTWHAPRVVLGLRREDGSFEPAPVPEPRRVISERTARTMASLMEGVIEEGTGKQAWVAGYRIAGKTGTARKSAPGRGYSMRDRIPSFVGFAPSHQPRLAGLVVLDSPVGSRYYGGQVAAPVFARIMGEALTHLRIPPDEDPLLDERPRETGNGAALVRAETRDGGPALADDGAEPEFIRTWTAEGQVPDVRGLPLRTAISVLADRGCASAVRGSGFVEEQDPPPATPLPAGGTCTIVLGERGPVPEPEIAVNTAPSPRRSRRR
jgi:cell division protein FtsI/penicillin-binding protein 2